MKIEFKIANQAPRLRFNSGDPKPTCGKCNTLLNRPLSQIMYALDNKYLKHQFSTFNYLATPHFILDTKSGYSIVYCSEYCMKKHNAKFRK